MKTKILFILALSLSIFVSCSDDEKLEASDIDSMSRFEFPEGDSEVDQIFSDIYDEHGVQVIYKNWTYKDWSKSWTNPSVIENIGFAGRHYEDGVLDSLTITAKFLRNEYFAYVSSDVAKQIFPPYIYLVNSYASVNRYPTMTILQYVKTNDSAGLDFMILSLSAYPDEKSNTSEIQYISAYSEIFGDDVVKLHQLRATLLWSTFIKKASSKEKSAIIPPSGFLNGLDLTAKLDTKNESDENYYLKRGYIDIVSEVFGKLSVPSSAVAANPGNTYSPNDGLLLFQQYIRLAMYYDKETIQEKYGQYPLVMERYNWTVSYMKDTYKIDLQGIAKK